MTNTAASLVVVPIRIQTRPRFYFQCRNKFVVAGVPLSRHDGPITNNRRSNDTEPAQLTSRALLITPAEYKTSLNHISGAARTTTTRLSSNPESVRADTMRAEIALVLASWSNLASALIFPWMDFKISATRYEDDHCLEGNRIGMFNQLRLLHSIRC